MSEIKKLFVKVEGIIETNLPCNQHGFDEFVNKFIDAIEAESWYIGGGFIPVDERGKKIRLLENLEKKEAEKA